jgi:rhodanese-related sulfurtransferase
VLVISENGTTSILACEFLNQMGFYNINNISGGYKFWPGYRKIKQDSAYSA